jgi:hypothetical protein
LVQTDLECARLAAALDQAIEAGWSAVVFEAPMESGGKPPHSKSWRGFGALG